jgi:hypothetical protein
VDFFSFVVLGVAVRAEAESGLSVRAALPVELAADSAAARVAAVAWAAVVLVADKFAAVAAALAGAGAADEVFVVIASTAGIFCVLCSCEAWSIAWIIIVDISEPAVTGAALAVADVGVPSAVVLFGVVEAAAGVFVDDVPALEAAVAAASTVVVSETVSRKGERAFRTVAGATIVIECVTGCCVAGVPVEVAGGVVAVAGVVLEFCFPGDEWSLCCCMTSEKLCD